VKTAHARACAHHTHAYMVDGARRGAHPYARKVRWLLLRISVAVRRGNTRILREWRLHCLKNSEAAAEAEAVAKSVVKCNLKQNKHKAKPAAAATAGARRSSTSSTRQGGGPMQLGGAALLNEVHAGARRGGSWSGWGVRSDSVGYNFGREGVV